MSSASSIRIEPGTAVGPYRVERRLAQGGMSVLYVALDPAGGRIVLKMVTPDIVTSSARARLLREARALAAVDHPGVVRVHGTGEHEGMPWIAMDHVDGTDLKRVLSERGPLPVDMALAYAIQAAEALVAAHDAGVIHRDLKPSNLLLTPDGRIVLVDFGIAKRRADVRDSEPPDGDVLTSAREVIGTPAYLSPEQLEHGLADERSDVWALGCVLYEMVVGAPPFGKGGSATTAAILRDEPVFPEHAKGAVVHVVNACLRKSSFARVASPRDLLLLLRDALDDPGSQLATVERGSSSPPRRSSTRPSARSSASMPAGPMPSSGSMKASARLPQPARPPSVPSPAIPSPAVQSSVPPSSLPPSSVPVRTSPRPSIPPPAPARPSSQSPSIPPSVSPSAPPRSRSSKMRVALTRGRIKGTAVRAGIGWFADTYGTLGVEGVLSLASPELQAMLHVGDPAFGLIASGWYDTHLIGELLELLERVAAPADPEEFASRLSEAIARDNVSGVYRALFRLIAAPPLLEANAQRVWRTYVDEGLFVVSLRGTGALEARVRGWSRHHPSVCRILSPMFESLLRAIGYTAMVVERTQCVAYGDGQCAFDGRWVV